MPDPFPRILQDTAFVVPALLDIGSREYRDVCEWLKRHMAENETCAQQAGIFIGMDRDGQFAVGWCPACGLSGLSIPMRSAGT